MKYLHDDVLAALSSKLMDCPIYDNAASNSRVLHGRIEAYTTKRTHQDKRYAVHLLERQIEAQETKEQTLSAATVVVRQKRQRSQSTSEPAAIPEPRPTLGRIVRSQSLDETIKTSISTTRISSTTSSAQVIVKNPTISTTTTTTTTTTFPLLQQSRRLWTDLILTLNLSFPDFDFANASEFTAVPLRTAVAAINQRIGDNAMLRMNFWPAIDNVVTLSQVSMVYSFIDTDDILQSKLLPENSQEDVIWSVNYFFVNKIAKRIVFFTCIETMQPVEMQRNSGAEASSSYQDEMGVEDNDSESVDYDMDPSMNAGGIPIGSLE